MLYFAVVISYEDRALLYTDGALLCDGGFYMMVVFV